MDQSGYSNLNLGIVCPMANEKDNAARFVQEVLKVCRGFGFRSIQFFTVFDRVCVDGTRDILKNLSPTIPELRVVDAPENRSVVDAYMRGYREAIQAKCDWILEIDAGFSHRPEDIPQFFKTMQEGGYDCVFATRFSHGGKIEKNSWLRSFISYGGTVATNCLLGTRLHDMTSGFELFKREALEWILARGIHSRGPFFQTEIKFYAHQLKITEVPIIYGLASHEVRSKTLKDAFMNLWRLYREKKRRSC